MKFRLNGKPYTSTSIPPRIERLRAFLKKLPANELLTTAELASKTGCSTLGLRSNDSLNPFLAGFSIRVRHPHIMRVWGNQRTIASLAKRKELIA